MGCIGTRGQRLQSPLPVRSCTRQARNRAPNASCPWLTLCRQGYGRTGVENNHPPTHRQLPTRHTAGLTISKRRDLSTATSLRTRLQAVSSRKHCCLKPARFTAATPCEKGVIGRACGTRSGGNKGWAPWPSKIPLYMHVFLIRRCYRTVLHDRRGREALPSASATTATPWARWRTGLQRQHRRRQQQRKWHHHHPHQHQRQHRHQHQQCHCQTRTPPTLIWAPSTARRLEVGCWAWPLCSPASASCPGARTGTTGAAGGAQRAHMRPTVSDTAAAIASHEAQATHNLKPEAIVGVKLSECECECQRAGSECANA